MTRSHEDVVVERITSWIDARAAFIANLRNLHPDWYDEQALARHDESVATCRAIATELRDGAWRQDAQTQLLVDILNDADDARPPGDGYCYCGERLDKEHSHGHD